VLGVAGSCRCWRRAGIQYIGENFLTTSRKVSPLIPSEHEEWGPSMLQATDQLLLEAKVTGGPKEFLLYSLGWSLPLGAPAVSMIS
jgi:hypothetical protein